MKKPTEEAPTRTLGEQERDNDAHRPDGSNGTRHDSTAQKTAQDQGPHSSERASSKNDLGFDPDSPDLEDPQVDPQGPAKPPRD